MAEELIPIKAVTAWLGEDIRAALSALEAMPMKLETHEAWMESRRNLLNALKTIRELERLAKWRSLGFKDEASGGTKAATKRHSKFRASL